MKFPATIQFLRLGYEYQSLKGARIDFDTKIFIDRFKTSLERINKREIKDEELFTLLAEINNLIKNNDLGKEFYKRLLSSENPIRLLDLEDYNNNDFAVVNELPFSIKEGTEEGSFRPDISILINGIPLAFLEVKHPDNSGGIQVEFERMINKRLKNDDYKKYFNLIQIISFSNNMEYEDFDDDIADEVRAGSFYTTPNGQSTTFSFFREDIKEYHSRYKFKEINEATVKFVVKDGGYNPNEPESPNDDVNKMLNQALEESEKYDEQVEEAQREGTANIPEEYHNYTNVFAVKDEFKDEIRNLKLPRFAFKKEGTLFSGDEAIYPVSVEYLNDGFNLNTARIPDGLISATEGVYKVDVETTSEGNVVKKSMLIREESDEFKRMLQMIPESSRVNVCKTKLVADLNNKFNNISHSAIVNYIDRIVASFKTEDEVVALQSNINAISIRIKNFINELLEEHRYKNFKEKLISNDIFINQDNVGYEMKMSITLPEHTSEYFRTLYEEEDNNVNQLEEKFMLKVASLPNVKWWHRNIDRSEYALNGYLNHYADFIVETNNGTIILVETKGEHLDGDDSKKKLELGKLWSTYSGPTKYKYFMAFERSPLSEDGADLLDNIIQKISRL